MRLEKLDLMEMLGQFLQLQNLFIANTQQNCLLLQNFSDVRLDKLDASTIFGQSLDSKLFCQLIKLKFAVYKRYNMSTSNFALPNDRNHW